jgi:NAD(P)-dependent dehydrogenase (short-subunit alcohol dehydrogenase family)
MDNFSTQWLDFSSRVAVVTGGTGVLLSPTVRTLARLGARIALIDLTLERAQANADELCADGCQATGFQADMTDPAAVHLAARQVLEHFGQVDILLNGAGGNRPQATTSAEMTFFELPAEAIHQVFDLNLMSAVYACQAFGRIMAERGQGTILNVASMASLRPLTRIVSYAAAKAALANFTQWLAVYMAQNYGEHLRVNAIAPGFFLTDQNRYLLTDAKSGDLTSRGQDILVHTPMGRFGVAEDVIGPAVWLLSPASAFVTGIVLPIDGGFSVYSGV